LVAHPELADGRSLRLQQLLDAGDQRLAVLPEPEQVDEGGVLLAIPDGVQIEDGRLRGRVQVGEAQPERVVREPVVPPYRDVVQNLRVAGRQLRVGAVTQPRQSHIVGVRVENDHAQAGLGEHPLEQNAQRVGLARSRLPTDERVPVEPTAVQCRRHAGSQQQLPDGESRPPGAGPGEPRADLLGLRRPHGGVVEGTAVGVEDDAGAPGQTDQDAGSRGCDRLAGGRLRVRPDVRDLTQPRPAVSLQQHVAAAPQRQVVERCLELEREAVDGRCQRRDAALDLLAHSPVAGDPLGQVELDRGFPPGRRPRDPGHAAPSRARRRTPGTIVSAPQFIRSG
jgi:hypothetical protein